MLPSPAICSHRPTDATCQVTHDTLSGVGLWTFSSHVVPVPVPAVTGPLHHPQIRRSNMCATICANEEKTLIAFHFPTTLFLDSRKLRESFKFSTPHCQPHTLWSLDRPGYPNCCSDSPKFSRFQSNSRLLCIDIPHLFLGFDCHSRPTWGIFIQILGDRVPCASRRFSFFI